MKEIKNLLMTIVIPSLGLFDLTSAGGVAVTKEQSFHSDASAKPFVYESLKDNGRILAFTVGGRRFNIEKTTFVAYVELPRSIPDQIITDDQIASLKEKTREIKDFSERFPRAAPLLEQNLDVMNNVSSKIETGYVLNDGAWQLREDYDKELKERIARESELTALREKEMKRKIQERNDFESAQRAKGFVEYKGEWLTKADAAARLAMDNMNAELSKLLTERSVKNATFKIFQTLDEGVLCEIVQGDTSFGGSDFCHVRDIILSAENEMYKGTLYYSGTFTYINKLNERKTVAAYCIDKNLAIKYLKEFLDYDEKGGRREVVEHKSDGIKSPSILPQELSFATGFGSGFFIGNEGYVVTNYHVVSDRNKIMVYHDGELLKAKIIAVSAVSDICILKVDIVIDGLLVSDREHESGIDIFALGYPQPNIQGLDLKVTKGVISGSFGLNNDATKYQIDSAIQPGNSGGPICDEHGKVVGVVVAKLDEIKAANITGSMSQNVNYAVKSTEVLALLRSKGLKIIGGSDKNIDLSRAKSATCLIATN